MRKMIVAIFVHLLAIVSFLRAYFSLPTAEQEQFTWQIGISTICIILVLAIAWELVDYLRSRPTRYRFFKERRIRRFMRLWLSSGGRAVVFTRDMSWANETNVRNVLFEKADRHELTICIEHMIPLAQELQERGANIIAYGELEVVPRSRYTIIDFERDSARVAVGGAVGKAHVIQKFRSGEHPYFAVAEDLAKILVAYNRHRNATSS
jgi:hypothetical protein